MTRHDDALHSAALRVAEEVAADGRLAAEVPGLRPSAAASPPAALTLDLVVPQVEMERMLLAALIADPAWIGEVQQVLIPADFTGSLHQRIFEGMVTLANAGRPFDYLVLAAHIEERHAERDYFGHPVIWHLAGLDLNMPVSSRPARDSYLAAVLERGARAQLQALGGDLGLAARGLENRLTLAADRNGGATAQSLAAAAVAELSAIAQRTSRQDALDLDEALEEAATEWQRRLEADCDLIGIPYGLRDLDDMTLGMSPRDLIVLGGRPGSGKTAMACCIALFNAVRGRRVLFFSIEMPRLLIVQRMQASATGIRLSDIRLGRMADWEAQKLARVYQEMKDLPMRIWQVGKFAGPPSIMDMDAETLRFASKWGGVDLVVVDYLQAIEPRRGRREMTEYEIATQVTKDLKLQYANRWNVPVIALCALKKGNTEPTIEDLKGTGEIASRADVVMMLDRPETRSQDPGLRGLGTLVIEKQRNGPTGRIELGFEGASNRWRSLAPPDPKPSEQRPLF